MFTTVQAKSIDLSEIEDETTVITLLLRKVCPYLTKSAERHWNNVCFRSFRSSAWWKLSPHNQERATARFFRALSESATALKAVLELRWRVEGEGEAIPYGSSHKLTFER